MESGKGFRRVNYHVLVLWGESNFCNLFGDNRWKYIYIFFFHAGIHEMENQTRESETLEKEVLNSLFFLHKIISC